MEKKNFDLELYPHYQFIVLGVETIVRMYGWFILGVWRKIQQNFTDAPNAVTHSGIRIKIERNMEGKCWQNEPRKKKLKEENNTGKH